MVSEVVMYQSMFVLGIIMLAFFTVSFNNYTDFAEQVTLENNMEQVLQEIGDKIHVMIESGRSKQTFSPSFTLTVKISLESEYAGFAYQIEFQNSTDGQALLVAKTSANSDVIASLNLGYLNGINPSSNQIDFSGILSSGDASPRIVYQWDATVPSEALLFD